MGKGTLPTPEVERLRATLLTKLGLASNAAPSAVLYRIMERSEPCGDVTIDAPGFDLGNVFQKAGIVPGPTLYYWHGWDEIDTFDRMDLLMSIRLLWTSAAPDDVDVFDDTLGWLLTVDHTGQVGCIRF
ncbi:MAG: hypothetical protein KF678_14015 [Phycisphaeraceae bacterium]|nr:hypothetical protein [Phycisphaeraceae bacterium]